MILPRSAPKYDQTDQNETRRILEQQVTLLLARLTDAERRIKALEP